MTDYPDPFWNPAAFDFADSLNLDIFLNSVRVQKQEIGLPDVYGAQQAMRAVGALPWIPDPVGRNWKHRDSILFCGSSYAGIFRPFSTRGRTTGRVVPVQDYAEMDSLRSLQTLFLTQIMARNGYGPADRYYGPIEQLCASLPDASRIALFDLCRASYVKRTIESGREIHLADGKIVEERPDIFSRYVESETPADWLWRRLTGGTAVRLVALGTVAEHGLLRLFQRRGMEIYLGQLGPFSFSEADLRDTSGSWLKVHAYTRLKCGPKRLETLLGQKANLAYWLQTPAWWSIRRPDEVEEAWRLLPTYHPRFQTATRILETRKIIDWMCPLPAGTRFS